MRPEPRPPRAFAVLSALLLVTGLALLGAAITRLPAVAGLWDEFHPAAEQRAKPTLRTIEPANGPQRAAPTPEPTAPAVPAAVTGDDADMATLAALEDMSAEFGRHQAALAEREQRLVLREAVMASVEARIGERLARLEALKDELERLSGQQAAEDQAKINQLVKVYEAMKAKNAAAIFDPMALDLLLPIVRGMRETKVAAIVAEMDPVRARALTAELARKGAPPSSR